MMREPHCLPMGLHSGFSGGETDAGRSGPNYLLCVLTNIAPYDSK